MAALQHQFDYDVVHTIAHLIPKIYCLMITDKKGNLQSYFASDECENCHTFSDLADIAKLFSLRMRLGEYDDTFGKFNLVTLVFEKYYLIGRFLPDGKILIIAFLKDLINLESYINKIIHIFKAPYFDDEQEIVKFKEKLTPIPPLPVDIQREKQKLTSKKYMLVAEPYDKKTKLI